MFALTLRPLSSIIAKLIRRKDLLDSILVTKMEEAKILEIALKNCHLLEQMLQDSLRTVRRLNVRYNIDWLVLNYKSYVNSIWEHYENMDQQGDHANLGNEGKQSLTRGSIGCLSTLSEITTETRRHTVSGALRSSTGDNASSASCVCRVHRDKLSLNDLDQNRNKLNYNVIKIKRSLETILMQLQRAIDTANRQSNYLHHGHGKGKDFICCH